MTHPYNGLCYARSLANGDPVAMSQTLGVPLRLRSIPGTDLRDACGLYPISPDLHEARREELRAEVQGLGAVSLVLVSDPLAPPPIPDSFDILRPYKPHHIVDPAQGAPQFSRHHRAEVRRALKRCTARPITLARHLEAFVRLYDVLIARHDLGPGHRFDAAHFAHLAAHPEAFPTIGAFVEDRLVSAHVWVRHGARAYSHLAASDAEGYGLGAAYAVYDCAIQQFAGCTITLGGAPDGAGGNGLDRFKRGFANAVRQTHLCGIIADATRYEALGAAAPDSRFFPRYRSPPGHRTPD